MLAEVFVVRSAPLQPARQCMNVIEVVLNTLCNFAVLPCGQVPIKYQPQSLNGTGSCQLFTATVVKPWGTDINGVDNSFQTYIVP